jgi:hypothetical protein
MDSKSATAVEKLRAFALDLNFTSPRSPYARLTDEFPVVAARLVDKCRADLLGQNGSYHYDCPMDRQFFEVAGLDSHSVRAFVATGATDEEVGFWMISHAKAPREQFLKWSRRFRSNPLWNFLIFEDWLHRRRHKKEPSC